MLIIYPGLSSSGCSSAAKSFQWFYSLSDMFIVSELWVCLLFVNFSMFIISIHMEPLPTLTAEPA